MSQKPEFGYSPEVGHAEAFVRATFLENSAVEEVKRPALEIQGAELSHWGKLADQVVEQLNQDKPVAVSLVRCWGKNDTAMGELADRFSKTQEDFPELLAPMISINGIPEKGDKDHMTTKAVQNARVEKDFRGVTAEVKNYTWTAGLNGPTALLYHLLEQRGVTSEQLQKVYILNQSFDVEMDANMCKRLSIAVKKSEYVLTIREESGMYAQDSEKRFELGEKIKMAMRDPKLLDDPAFVQEFARAGRNTGMLVPVSDIVEMGGFNNACNALGGMEDHDLYMRLLLKELDGVRRGKGPSQRLKKMLRAFADPLVYNDPAWNKMVAEGKEAPKVAAEGNAINNIFQDMQNSWSHAKGPDDYITPEENKDFVFAA